MAVIENVSRYDLQKYQRGNDDEQRSPKQRAGQKPLNEESGVHRINPATARILVRARFEDTVEPWNPALFFVATE